MKKRVLSIFLCVLMCLSFVPASAFADGGHVHDSECGYAESVAGAPCTHECGEDCSPCTHEHDEACGYAAAVESAPCTYVEPEDNKPEEEQLTDSKPEEEQLTDNKPEEGQPAESKPEQEQPKDEAPKADEAVAAVQTEVDALPAVEAVASMSAEQKSALSKKLDALCDAYYDGLSEAQQAQVTGFDKVGELYDALGAYSVDITDNDSVPYFYYENGEKKYRIRRGGEYITVTSSTTSWENNNWYVVSDNVTIAHVDVKIAANLILCDGARLEVTDIGGDHSHTLNIYGQEKDSGTLVADGKGKAGIEGNASIKGEDITINGGTVIATGYTGAGIGGDSTLGNAYTITINGGNVTATSIWGAGIGGGDGGNGGNVTINGGNVTATSSYGAGIGGGGNGGNGENVTIYGGNITATSSYGAGIGGGDGGNGGNVTINGGNIAATSNKGAGIGGGDGGNGGNVTINGGNVTAKGAYNSAGIGGGNRGNGGKVTIYGGTVKATGSITGSSGGPGIGGSQGKDQGILTLGAGVTFGAGESADNITEWTNLANARTMNYFQSPFTAPAHTHSFSFSASQNKAIATCANTDGACQLDEDGKHTVTLTLTANNSTYTGSAYNGASVSGADNFTSTTDAAVGAIQYLKDGSQLTAAPTDAGSYTAKVTVTKGESSATAEAAFTIAKAAATITTNPTAAAITYGQALSASALTGGTASVPGSFAWDNGSTVPAVADSGVTAYNVKFTPTDASNYTEATVQITLIVNKADYTDAVKTASGTLPAKSGQTVEITLPAVPAGAAYGEVTNGNTAFFTVGAIANGKVTVTSAKDWDSQTETEAKTFTVAVTPDANHNDYDITVTVTPSFHSHSWSDAWTHDAKGHWHPCAAKGCYITDYSTCGESGAAYAVHSFNGNTCTVCAYAKGSTYTIIEGANSEWTKGSKSGLAIKSDAPFSKFSGVKVDGKVVAGSNYTAVEGSTKVTFTPAYLESLSIGKHTAVIVSADGTAATQFTIKSNVVYYTVSFNMHGRGHQVASQTVEAGSKAVRPADPRAYWYSFGGWYADAGCTVPFNFNTPIYANTVVYAKWIYSPYSPKTGDSSNILLWSMLMLASCGAVAGAVVYSRKKKK